MSSAPDRAARPRTAARGLAVLLAAAVALTGCAFGGGDDIGDPTPPSPASSTARATPTTDPAKDPALQRFYGQQPSWKPCRDVLECATVTVPLDWSKPAGKTISLAVARRKATEKKIGTLMFNPGGPGVPSLDYIVDAARFGTKVQESYDVLAWDTRGVGESTAIRCLPNDRLDTFYAADASPDDPAELRTALDLTKEYAQACVENTGELIEHVDTLSTVRDMDVLRAVVGDEVLTFFGASYGTFLGAWYAQTFPWRAGRLVLDGAVDPSLSAAQYTEGQTIGFSRAVRAYVQDCLGSRGCPLRGTQEEAYQQIQSLVQKADARPLRTASGRQLTQALMITGLAQGMYLDAFWPTVSKGLTEALQGEGTTLLALADAYLQRDATGKYGPSIQASGAMSCIDRADTRSAEQIAAGAADLGKRYPPLGDQFGWGALTCSVWPVKQVVPQQRLTADGAPPILVIGTTNDPATPYEWAKGLASQLSSGVLLTREGNGHTGYKQGSKCVDTAVDRYLVTGTPPQADLTCGPGS